MDRLAFAFAALGEPGGETFGKTLGSEAKAGFEAAIGGRECVVKVGGVGEIAHGELIEPFERARPPLAADQHIHLKFLGVHGIRIALARFMEPASGRWIRPANTAGWRRGGVPG